MKIDFRKELVGVDGKTPLRLNGSALLLKDVCIRAFLDKLAGEELKEDDFIHRYKLMLEIAKAKDAIELADSDLVALRRLLREVQGFSVFVIGQVLSVLKEG